MATKPDIIVLDEEKYPHIATVGTKCGSWMNLEYYELEDTHFQYIPPHVHYLRFDYDTATYGMRLWGETRNMKSEYGVDDSGTTLKEKVEVDSTLGTKYVKPFMIGVITLKIQEIFEERYSTLYDSWGGLERETWTDQLCEATAYIADNSFETKLIHRLAEVRGLTTADFAAIVIEKQDAWKTKVYDLAVQEQTLITKLKSSANVMEVVVFLEDYFGESMTSEQCLDYGRCTQDEETGLISRKSEVKYGIQF
ncbi:hypothetical protein PRAG_00159 [Prochlorococcus phage P-SSM3]|uniref:Uncharacterized protein n=1 Tax=Prochlorococcus phage P-SSM3 TaxID=536453 RepID=R9S5N3_9CAUD|nr:hypothetical protein PRAG_00159 [Prochlorococcus phage P-SSM3]AGN12097.1 hypothetical protein PRAG_00159 [Prochlorococcus phage P-SSM3]